MKNMLFALIISLTLIMPNYAYAKNVTVSWYECCTTTANGEHFNPDGMTAAHRSLPFGTKVKFTYKGKSVIVRINDRGPFVGGREYDLSRGAANRLGCAGVCQMKAEVL